MIPLLLDAGHEVLSVERPRGGRPTRRHPRLTHYEDRGDQNALGEALQRFGPQTCVHLATSWISMPTPSDVAVMAESNITFGIRVVDAFERAGGEFFVNASSYFQRVGGVPRTSANTYAAMKNAFEDYLRWRSERHGLRVLDIELYDTYAADDTRPTVWSQLMSAAVERRPFFTTEGQQILAPLHIDDAASGFVRAVDLVSMCVGPWTEHHVAGQLVLTLRDALAVLIDVIDINVDIQWGRRPYSGAEAFAFTPVGTALPGWNPRWTLEAGLQDAWSRYVPGSPPRPLLGQFASERIRSRTS